MRVCVGSVCFLLCVAVYGALVCGIASLIGFQGEVLTFCTKFTSDSLPALPKPFTYEELVLRCNPALLVLSDYKFYRQYGVKLLARTESLFPGTPKLAVSTGKEHSPRMLFSNDFQCEEHAIGLGTSFALVTQWFAQLSYFLFLCIGFALSCPTCLFEHPDSTYLFSSASSSFEKSVKGDEQGFEVGKLRRPRRERETGTAHKTHTHVSTAIEHASNPVLQMYVILLIQKEERKRDSKAKNKKHIDLMREKKKERNKITL